MKQIPFYSKRNQVYPVLRQGHAAVEKHFVRIEDWERESGLYAALEGRLPLPKILAREPGLLVLEYCRAITLLEELERQEQNGFSPAPWKSLAAWLRQCDSLCHQLPAEGNLRNFLLSDSQIIGLDLECYGPDSLEACGARLIAAVLTYRPENTAVKRQAAGVLANALHVPDLLADQALYELRTRRSGRQAPAVSGIVLAGGRSRRMGREKAALELMGKTLLQRQVEKLRALGIQDIMLSGTDSQFDARAVPDEYIGKGPLGGLHACLRAARNPACLVVGVDIPLIPETALAHLREAHSGGVTVLRHGKWEEPLLGVYDRAAAGPIAALIESGRHAVRALREVVPWNHFDYLGPEELLVNCNTPEDFDAAERLARAYATAQLPL